MPLKSTKGSQGACNSCAPDTLKPINNISSADIAWMKGQLQALEPCYQRWLSKDVEGEYICRTYVL